tara:strand:+ start:733 stop:924 length:192 start_codon:yes stop_codon:yes gene_type:complete
MQTIKFLPNNQIKLSNKTYKGYTIGNIPKKFAFIYDEDKDQEGITEWFNYKGLTYVQKSILPW